MAVTRQPAATASTSSASESAPPDTAQVDVGPRLREAAAGQEVVPEAHGGAHASQVDPSQPAGGVPDLGQGRQAGRVLPDRVQDGRAADGLDRFDEPLALLVLGQLGLEADEALQQAGQAVGLLAPLAQDPAEAGGGGDLVGAGPVHGHVAVALQQAHQARDPLEREALLGRGQDRGEAAVVNGLRPSRRSSATRPMAAMKRLGIGVDGPDDLVHQRRGSGCAARGCR